MTTKLYVGNLSFRTTSDDLKQLFEQAEMVESASEGKGGKTSRSRGFGFIELATVEEGHERDKQVKRYFTEIAETRERARKTQAEINRLKKKTQAIIDKLS